MMKILSRLCLALLIMACLTTRATASPKVAVDMPNFNFGTILQGKKVKHLFTVRNRGDAPLIIKAVRPSCGCTAASVTSSVIPAGESGGIRATFDSVNFAGTVHKTILVETNDPDKPASSLTLTGTVAEELQVEPRRLDLGRIKVKSTFRSNLVVTNRGKKSIRIMSVTSSLPSVEATAARTDLKPGESLTIPISINPHTEGRLLSGYLRIMTDIPSKPQILVPVFGSLIN
jgi:Protein of unknown function (DUF1573)/HYDIN/CFA65/VesB-like, Ig-like domain